MQFLSVLFLIFNIVLFAPAQHAIAACESSLKLEGTIIVDSCAPDENECIPASKAIFDYSQSAKMDSGVYSLFMHSSPWHLYDGNMRIITVEELAEIVKSQMGDKYKSIELIASWSGVAPDPNGKSLAQKLSDALGGFPVKGMDGFVWLSKAGVTRTTTQANTIKRMKYPYRIHPGGEVMASAAVASPIDFEEDYVTKKDAEGIMRVGAALDIFSLCHDKALEYFEAGAKLSNSIAAYNAALIHLERGKKGDLEAATALLSQAAALGDKKAQARLQKLKRQEQ